MALAWIRVPGVLSEAPEAGFVCSMCEVSEVGEPFAEECASSPCTDPLQWYVV